MISAQIEMNFLNRVATPEVALKLATSDSYLSAFN